MGRRIDMRGRVHRGGDTLRQHAGLGHIVDAFDLDVFEIRPIRALEAPSVRQVVKIEPHRILQIRLELDPPNHDHSRPLL